MDKLLALALFASCSAALAQTPATNPMPDGSRDMYLGLGAVSAPRYEGGGARKVSALPVLQVQWSNGLFISGLSAGIHLSSSPSVEFGPLLAFQPRRTESGLSTGAVGDIGDVPTMLGPRVKGAHEGGMRDHLNGMNRLDARLQAGAFFNYYLAPRWRLTSNLLYGGGNGRDGAVLDLGVQQLAMPLAQHHTLALSAGVALANGHYSQSFFGVSTEEALRSGNAPYAAAGGLKDAHLGARWNWTLSPSWLVTSSVQGTRLLGSARNSPLVERPANLTVSTAIAYRF